MAMYCRNCGVSLPENVRFCSACGTVTGFAQPAAAAAVSSPLMRRREGRKVAGVCVGFARAYGWDVLLVRILMMVAGVILFPLAEIAYIVAWIAMPEELLSLPFTTGLPPSTTGVPPATTGVPPPTTGVNPGNL